MRQSLKGPAPQSPAGALDRGVVELVDDCAPGLAGERLDGVALALGPSLCPRRRWSPSSSGYHIASGSVDRPHPRRALSAQKGRARHLYGGVRRRPFLSTTPADAREGCEENVRTQRFISAVDARRCLRTPTLVHAPDQLDQCLANVHRAHRASRTNAGGGEVKPPSVPTTPGPPLRACAVGAADLHAFFTLRAQRSLMALNYLYLSLSGSYGRGDLEGILTHVWGMHPGGYV